MIIRSIQVATQVKAFLHSDNGNTTPELDNVQVMYDFAGDNPDGIHKCIVWGYLKDSEGNPLQTLFTVYLNKDVVQYKTNISIRNQEIEVTPDSDGYWEIELIDTENMEGEDVCYIFKFSEKRYLKRQVPEEESKNIWELSGQCFYAGLSLV